jgi:hypothetical protein
MLSRGLSWPNWAYFVGSVVANGKDEIKFRRSWTGEFLP